ncbi:hypothetical protein BXT84_14115 [Sulfobacillus thermotolerans]|uniref:Site-specific integrase n=1 Tax=Sulfobacillus thermotolerans TaxID=338644 RepID=A0ABM6RU14_9FIRM|nr:hypothetical protein BXT84_14115 [Sulfobacillus thermotolerans]
MADKRKVSETHLGTVRGMIYATDTQKKWLVKWTYHETGKKWPIREQKIVYGLKINAEQFLENIMREIDSGKHTKKAQKMTVEQWLEQWLDAKKNGIYGKSIKDKTLVTYQQRIQYICKFLGQHTVQDLTTQDVQKFVNNAMRDNTISLRTKQYTFRVLKMSLNDAEAWEIIGRNPAAKLKIGQNASPKRIPLNIEQLQQVMTQLQHEQYGLPLEFIAVTGVRVGECLGLTWDCIDFEKGNVEIKQQLTEIGNKIILEQTTKTASSQRFVALPTTFVAKLKAHRRTQLQMRLKNPSDAWQNDFVFATQNGTPISPNNLRRTFRRVLKKCGLPPYHVHDLRHTYATLLYDTTKNIKLVSEMLGHTSTQITIDTYTHTTDHAKEEIAHIVDDLFYQ